MVGTAHCKHSAKAKKILSKNKIAFGELHLDELYGKDQMEVANCIFGDKQIERYVPLTYYNGRIIKTYEELHDLDADGKLKANEDSL